jgi:hypothetical protein
MCSLQERRSYFALNYALNKASQLLIQLRELNLSKLLGSKFSVNLADLFNAQSLRSSG